MKIKQLYMIKNGSIPFCMQLLHGVTVSNAHVTYAFNIHNAFRHILWLNTQFGWHGNQVPADIIYNNLAMKIT